MRNISKHIHCDNCNTLTETKVSDVEIVRLGQTHIVKNLKIEICPNCSEKYIDGKDAKKFENQFRENLIAA
jgi:YgiT-type zinc finger domain-containing protein